MVDDVTIPDLPPVASAELADMHVMSRSGFAKHVSSQQMYDLFVATLTATAPAALDTWLELVAQIEGNESGLAALVTEVGLRLKRDGSNFADETEKATFRAAAGVAAAVPGAGAEIVLVTAVGYGSTATRIVRFATVERNNGGAFITLTQSATNGDSFTVVEDGTYVLSAACEFSEVDREYGVTVNQPVLTTDITAVSVALQICSESPTQNRRSNCSATLALLAGDVLRVCTDGGTLGTGAGDARFRITRLF